MKIELLNRTNMKHLKQAASLLAEYFPQSYSETAERAVKSMLKEENIALMAIEDGELVGIVGAIPQYGVTAWELHPLAVDKNYRRHDIGTRLVQMLEEKAREKGCITMYLGADDELNQTSLSQSDLFIDTFEKIQYIENIKRHPYEFYLKIGYKITGVIPDANGFGKPDIFMSKRICSKNWHGA